MNLHGFLHNSNRQIFLTFFAAVILIFASMINVSAQTLEAYNPNANVTVDDIEPLPDGKSIVCGQFTTIGGGMRRAIARLNADGTLDTTFPVVDTAFQNILDAVIQPDGKILISGGFSTINGVARVRIARLNADGTLDTGFDVSLTPPVGSARLALLPDGKIMIPANFGNSINRVLRRNSDGSADASFTSPVFNGTIAQVTAQPDGKVIAVGGFSTIDGITQTGIARLNANGTLDTSFNPNSNNAVFLATLAPNGKIYAGGNFTSIGGQTRSYFARLNSDGTADTTFQNPQIVGTGVRPSLILPSGKILIAGTFDTVGGVARKQLARLNTDGTLDTTFRNMQVGVDSFSAPAMIKLQQDGKLLVVGNFTTVDGVTRNRLARITVTDEAVPSNADFDFDGDRKSDVSVFRPSVGGWYISQSSNNAFSGTTFGQSGDVIAPADFDGDGRTDISVFRQGNWYRLNSSNNSFSAVSFGIAGDLPVPADFDGDDKTDISVFRPSTGNWYRLNSSDNSFTGVAFGIAEDKPTIGDFDGDGKADIAVFRPSTGSWYRLNSSNGNFTAVNFGIAEDKPAAADFDGDGKTDITVFRPSNGVWYRLNSSNGGFEAIAFGITGDLPSAADFDGDGKADVTVFRPSTGTWYQMLSLQGFSAQTFGTNGDIPTPNAFVK